MVVATRSEGRASAKKSVERRGRIEYRGARASFL